MAASAVLSSLPLELSVILPTFKERENVAEIVRRLDLALAGIGWEAIFVDDDSPDGTAEAAKALALQDPRVRCLRRIGRRGLAGACIEGILSSSAPYIAVMDADLQHDETVMLEKLKAGAELVAATRYIEGGSAAAFGQTRGALSRLATKLTRRILGTTLSDPMSGFFAMRRAAFDAVAPKLSPIGFKILLDIATSAGASLKLAEQPYVFGARAHGESKFDSQVGLEFLGLLLAKMTGGFLDPRFLFFAIVGATGILVHLAALNIALGLQVGPFVLAQTIATFTAIVSNFFFNNLLTYRDRRLRGFAMLGGFLRFLVFSAVGALANVGVAQFFYEGHSLPWIAGLAGALMGALWNYAMSSLFVWRTR